MTIAIIGANGQVGSEVALALSATDGVTVIPICRSELGSSFLRHCGIPCRHGDVGDPREARRLLASCDLVVDFSLPRGLPSETRAASKRILDSIMAAAPAGVPVVYISSISAFGMGPRSRRIRRYLIAHTAYAALKRYAERLARRAGRRHQRSVYVLRLGQVHGRLQGVSRQILAKWQGRPARVPQGPSYAVFAATIASALVAIASGRETPGVYTMVESPAWSWKEVLEFHGRWGGERGPVIEEARPDRSLRRVMRALVERFVLAPVVTLVSARADAIAGNLLVRVPGLELRASAMYRIRQARRELAASDTAAFRPYQPYIGVAPGARLRSVGDSRFRLRAQTQRIDRIVQSAVAPAPAVPELVHEGAR